MSEQQKGNTFQKSGSGIRSAAEDAYHAVEDGTVKGYKSIETGVV